MNSEDLERLETEGQNKRSLNLDSMSEIEIAKLMNAEDQTVALAVEKENERIAILSKAISESISNGGKCYYVGAGTSGRIAVIDAAETVPTFNIPYGTFTAVLAGGLGAMVRSLEKIEDDLERGRKEMIELGVSPRDVVVGISASGRTPFVIGAIEAAKGQGVFTGCIVNVSDSQLSKMVDVAIEAVTGPEVIAGSTRLKAGTAQKMILNMLSTISMIRLGKVYKNLMVDVMPINEKLVNRATRIISSVTDVDAEKAAKLLDEAGNRPKIAIVMAITGKNPTEVEEALEKAHGKIKEAIKELS